MAASRLGHRLHPETQDSPANLVRAVNCYYPNRNRIEAHNTSLREIERVMSKDFDADNQRRNLQIEARAHIRLQRQINRMPLEGYPNPRRWFPELASPAVPRGCQHEDAAAGRRRVTGERIRIGD